MRASASSGATTARRRPSTGAAGTPPTAALTANNHTGRGTIAVIIYLPVESNSALTGIRFISRCRATSTDYVVRPNNGS